MSSLFDDLPGFQRPDTATLPGAVPPRDDDAWAYEEPPEDPWASGEPAHAPAPEPDEIEAAWRGGAAPATSSSHTRPDPDALVEGLNPQQREAVLHSGSPLLIVAGAGSGKTRVLTHRIAHLLATGRARAGEILAITFTNKAAAEMRERAEALVGPPARAMWVSTFHSACVRILRREHAALGLRSSFSIYDAADAQRLMTLVCRELDLDPKRFPPKMFARRISDLKNELVAPETFAATASDANPVESALANVFSRYTERLRQANALDFDDLIATTVRLLRTHPDIAEHYRRRFRHVLVDEYQDTNHAQYALVRELAGAEADDSAVPPGELTVVGDADQSIYAFRGATIRNIEEFEADYPSARTILLEQNYRSTQTILSAANAVIAQNAGRRPKKLWTDSGDGEKIVGYVSDSEHDEAKFIAEEIDQLGDTAGVKPRDVAIFYRTNAQSRALEEVLIRVGLPYKVVGGTRFYERREIKDAIAYLRAVANPDDAVNLRRILNVPKRGLGDRAEAMLAAHAERHRVSFGEAIAHAAAPEGSGTPEVLGLATRSRTQVTAFAQLLSELRELAATATPAEVLDAALDRSGYLAELRASEDPQDATRVENLAELHAVAAEFSEKDPEGDLADFLERVALVADSDQIPDAGADDTGQVTLMTVHTAKGLEFDVVFVTGMEDGTFPHQRALGEPTELAEERRLAYVALTRARKRLYLSRAAQRTTWGMPQMLPASRFLDEVPAELIDWRRLEASIDAYGDGWGDPDDNGGGRSGGRSAGGWSGGNRAGGRSGAGSRGGSRSGPVVRTTRLDAGSGSTAAPRGGGKGGGSVPNLDVGDLVTHDTYGVGTVVGVEGSGSSTVARVDFRGGDVKRLLLRYSPVTKL